MTNSQFAYAEGMPSHLPRISAMRRTARVRTGASPLYNVGLYNHWPSSADRNSRAITAPVCWWQTSLWLIFTVCRWIFIDDLRMRWWRYKFQPTTAESRQNWSVVVRNQPTTSATVDRIYCYCSLAFLLFQ